jgi:hypothetical protein
MINLSLRYGNGSTDADYNLRLFGPDRIQPIAQSSNPGKQEDTIQLNLLPGIYYVQVKLNGSESTSEIQEEDIRYILAFRQVDN